MEKKGEKEDGKEEPTESPTDEPTDEPTESSKEDGKEDGKEEGKKKGKKEGKEKGKKGEKEEGKESEDSPTDDPSMDPTQRLDTIDPPCSDEQKCPRGQYCMNGFCMDPCVDALTKCEYPLFKCVPDHNTFCCRPNAEVYESCYDPDNTIPNLLTDVLGGGVGTLHPV